MRRLPPPYRRRIVRSVCGAPPRPAMVTDGPPMGPAMAIHWPTMGPSYLATAGPCPTMDRAFIHPQASVQDFPLDGSSFSTKCFTNCAVGYSFVACILSFHALAGKLRESNSFTHFLDETWNKSRAASKSTEAPKLEK